MKLSPFSLVALLLAAPALASGGGRLGTLERGSWVCELPGDAEVGRGIPAPEAGFTITISSTYRTQAGTGKYLRAGEIVTMTSGPQKGTRYRMQSERMLRRIDADGNDAGLRCVRRGASPL